MTFVFFIIFIFIVILQLHGRQVLFYYGFYFMSINLGFIFFIQKKFINDYQDFNKGFYRKTKELILSCQND